MNKGLPVGTRVVLDAPDEFPAHHGMMGTISLNLNMEEEDQEEHYEYPYHIDFDDGSTLPEVALSEVEELFDGSENIPEEW